MCHGFTIPSPLPCTQSELIGGNMPWLAEILPHCYCYAIDKPGWKQNLFAFTSVFFVAVGISCHQTPHHNAINK